MATTSGNYLDTGISASWTGERTVREAINGDKCIIGNAVSDLAFTPAYIATGGAQRNGVELNTTSGTAQAFDARAAAYSSANAFTGSDASPGDSFLVTKSTDDPSVSKGFDNLNRSRLDYAAVLSFISTANDPGSVGFFRPAYAGTTKVIHLVSELTSQESLLESKSLASVPSAPADLDNLVDRFKRIQVDHTVNPNGQSIKPKFHMRQYGGSVALDISNALIALHSDYEIADKRPLLYAMVQYGIDLYYAMDQGSTIFTANGGHNHGRKAVVVFTAIMLNNATMKAQIKEWSKL